MSWWTEVTPATYDSYATLKAAIPTSGAIAYAPRIFGAGLTTYRGDGMRWLPTDVLGTIANPLSVTVAGSTTPVDVPIGTLPGGLIADGMEFEISYPTSCIVGSNAVTIYIGGVAVGAAGTMAAGQALSEIYRFAREGAVIRKTLSLINIVAISLPTFAVDLSVDQPIILRITPAVGGSMTIHRLAMRIIS